MGARELVRRGVRSRGKSIGVMTRSPVRDSSAIPILRLAAVPINSLERRFLEEKPNMLRSLLAEGRRLLAAGASGLLAVIRG